MRTETKLLPDSAKRKRGIASPPEADSEIILRNISASTGKSEENAVSQLRRRCWKPRAPSLGLVAAFPVAFRVLFCQRRRCFTLLFPRQ